MQLYPSRPCRRRILASSRFGMSGSVLNGSQEKCLQYICTALFYSLSDLSQTVVRFTFPRRSIHPDLLPTELPAAIFFKCPELSCALIRRPHFSSEFLSKAEYPVTTLRDPQLGIKRDSSDRDPASCAHGFLIRDVDARSGPKAQHRTLRLMVFPICSAIGYRRKQQP